MLGEDAQSYFLLRDGVSRLLKTTKPWAAFPTNYSDVEEFQQTWKLDLGYEPRPFYCPIPGPGVLPVPDVEEGRRERDNWQQEAALEHGEGCLDRGHHVPHPGGPPHHRDGQRAAAARHREPTGRPFGRPPHRAVAASYALQVAHEASGAMTRAALLPSDPIQRPQGQMVVAQSRGMRCVPSSN